MYKRQNEGIPAARLPSVELSPASPSPVTTSSSDDLSSSDGGAEGQGRKSAGHGGRGARPGGAIGAGWEEEKGGDGRAASAPLLDGEKQEMYVDTCTAQHLEAAQG